MYVPKPIESAELVAAIANLAGRIQIPRVAHRTGTTD
jgi:hypothetical protein